VNYKSYNLLELHNIFVTVCSNSRD